MTFVEAFVVSRLPMVATVWINDPIETESEAQALPKDESHKRYRRKSLGKARKERPPVHGSVSEQIPSPDHLKVISQDPSRANIGAALGNFRYDPSFREDVHLYILDRGKYSHS